MVEITMSESKPSRGTVKQIYIMRTIESVVIEGASVIRGYCFPSSTQNCDSSFVCRYLGSCTRGENKSWDNRRNRNSSQHPALSTPPLKLIPQSKWKVSLPNSRPLKRGRDSNIEPLVLINIIVVVAIVKVIVIVLMGEFCGRLWLRQLSQDLFSLRVD